MAYRPITNLYFSDLHCGSIFGLLPPDYELPDPQSLDLDDTEYQIIKRTLSLNKGQAYLWEIWQDGWKWLPPKIDVGVLNGDGLHGPVEKKGRGIYSAINLRPSVQADILKAVLKPIRHRFHDFYILAGSEWHEGELGERLAELAKSQEIDACPHPSGQYIDSQLFLDVEGVTIDTTHELSYYMIYRGTPLEREINFTRIEDALVEGAPDLIVRSHVHVWAMHRNRHATALSTPAFQLAFPGPRVKQAAARARLTDLGFVLAEIYPERKAQGERPIEIKERLYPHPKYKAVKVEIRRKK